MERERVFVLWWILFPLAGIHICLAIVCAANGWWIGVPIFIALAIVSVWFGLVHRIRLQRLEEELRR